MKKYSPRAALCVAALAIFCTLACQGQESKTPAAEKITIAYPLSMYAVLYQIAYTNGYFRAEGLAVTPQAHEFGKLAIRSLVEGKADLAISGDTVTMFAMAEGARIAIIAENLTSKKNEAIVARKDRGITAPRHLEGRPIGVALGTTGHFFLDTFLTVNGVDKKRVRFVNMTPGQMTDALAKGVVDAVAVWEPHIGRIAGFLGAGGEVFYDQRIYSDMVCMTASREFVKTRPKTTEKVLRALLKAESFVKDSPEASRRIVSEAFKIDKALLDRIWGNLYFRVNLEQSLLVSLEDQWHWARENGLVKGDEHFNFLDYISPEPLQSIAPEAVKIIR